MTYVPKPVTSREGFYQCVEVAQPAAARTSLDSVSSVVTLESELDEPTAPTTWTSPSSPRGAGSRDLTIRTMRLDERRDEKSIELTRRRTFGEEEHGLEETWRMEPIPGQGNANGRYSVGIAF